MDNLALMDCHNAGEFPVANSCTECDIEMLDVSADSQFTPCGGAMAPCFKPMDIKVNARTVPTDEQGYLLDHRQWSESFAEAVAQRDGVTLYDDHWGLILYFRDYYEATGTIPTMHILLRTLGRQHGGHFHDEKTYARFLYRLFPTDPVHELCKLAGLPRPEPDT